MCENKDNDDDDYKLAEDINTLKKDIGTQFVRAGENISEVKGLMSNTKSDLYKFDDKFSLEEDDTNESTWVKVAGKHVDARLGQVASQVQTMQKALQFRKLQKKNRIKRPDETTLSYIECQRVMLFWRQIEMWKTCDSANSCFLV